MEPILGEDWSLTWISDGTKGPSADFGYSYIYDVAVSDDLMNVYVLDGMACVIHQLNPDSGEVIRTFGREGSGPGEFQSSYQIAWANGGLWLGDTGLNRLTHFSPIGEYKYSFNLKNFYIQPIYTLHQHSESHLRLCQRSPLSEELPLGREVFLPS